MLFASDNTPIAIAGVRPEEHALLIQRFFNLSFVLAIAATFVTSARAQDLSNTGDLAGGTFFSTAYGVSGDGSAAVGASSSAAGFEAFAFSPAGGIVGLGDLAGGAFSSTGYGISRDGSVIVGRSVSVNGLEAFRWTQAGGMVGLGDLAGGGFSSVAFDVSDDGSVLVGRGLSANGSEAFRWTQAGGMVGLGSLATGVSFYSRANAVNSDGSVVVGSTRSPAAVVTLEAFRWTQAGGMVGLGDLAGGVFHSEGNDVNADGSVVVGFGTSAAGTEAFRWTQAGGMVSLGDLAGGVVFSHANGVNADGSVVVGDGNSAAGGRAFYWTATSGMAELADVLSGLGVNVAGIVLEAANDVSDDGQVVVGVGDFGNGGQEGFFARLSDENAGLITAGELLTSISQTAALIEGAHAGTFSDLDTMVIAGREFQRTGARSRVSTSNEAWDNPSMLGGPRGDGRHSDASAGDLHPARGVSGFAVGTFFGHTEDAFDDRSGRGSAGLIGDLGFGLRAGLAVHTSRTRGDLPYLGTAKTDAAGGGLFIGFHDPHSGLELVGSATAQRLDLDIERGYLNGASRDSSLGETSGTTWGGLLRGSYSVPVLGGVSLVPFAEYAVVRSRIDAIYEFGGAFPVTFDETSANAKRVRAGMEIRSQINATTRGWAWAAWNKRVDNDAARVSGDVQGLFAFDLAGDAFSRNGADIGAGLNWQLAPGFETLATVGSTFANDLEPELSVRFGGSLALAR